MGGQPRSVLRRALQILNLVGSDENGLSLSELSRHTGLPLTTTHRIVAELTEWGALERESLHTYRIGLRLWEIAAQAPRSVGLRRVALPFMQDLYETTHRGVHLAVREGREVVFVERFDSPETVGGGPRIGGRYPLHATAVGQVLLAYAPTDLRNDILSGPLERFTEHTLTSAPPLRRIMAEIRRAGYTISDRQITPKYAAIASPIFQPGSGVIASVSLIVPYNEVRGPGMGYLVLAIARGISRALGAQMPETQESQNFRYPESR